jgi:acetolactate synthase-1/2/3 large subunit
MIGANALLSTLVGSGVTTCFTNPGTSEMHFVAALDSVPEMRAVLGLFEGVATGAADGYVRITGQPAATLLHLGPGLDLPRARRAGRAGRVGRGLHREAGAGDRRDRPAPDRVVIPSLF